MKILSQSDVYFPVVSSEDLESVRRLLCQVKILSQSDVFFPVCQVKILSTSSQSDVFFAVVSSEDTRSRVSPTSVVSSEDLESVRRLFSCCAK